MQTIAGIGEICHVLWTTVYGIPYCITNVHWIGGTQVTAVAKVISQCGHTLILLLSTTTVIYGVCTWAQTDCSVLSL